MIYWDLFISFLKIGAFSFGGGYAALPLIQHQVVDEHAWLTLSEFTDLITISQMTPGPIVINSATFVGLNVAGIGGAIVSTLGCILPSCIMVSSLAYAYIKYKKMDMMTEVLNVLRPAVVSMIASAGVLILTTAFFGHDTVTFATFKPHMLIIFFIAMFLLEKKKIDPIMVMLSAGVMNVIYNVILMPH